MLPDLHPDEVALLRGVCHAPTDPTARGVYADWVQEHVRDDAFDVPEQERSGMAERAANTLRSDAGDDYAGTANAARLYRKVQGRLVLSDPDPADYSVRADARLLGRFLIPRVEVDLAGTLGGDWRGLPCLFVARSVGQLCAAELAGLWRVAPVVAVVWPAARFAVTRRHALNQGWRWDVPAHDVPRQLADKHRWLTGGECEPPFADSYSEAVARRFVGRRCVDLARARCGLPPLFPGRKVWEREVHDVVLDEIEQHAYRVPDSSRHSTMPWYDLDARGPSVLDPRRVILGLGGV